MGAFSFHIELKTPNRDGTQSLRIRITRDRAKAYLNLGLHLKKGEFNPKFDYRKDNYITSKHPRYQTVNEGIRTTLDELDRLKNQHHDKTAKELKSIYEHGEADRPQTFFGYLEERVALKRTQGQYAGSESLYQAGAALKSFADGRPDRTLLTPAFIASFTSSLLQKKAPMTVRQYVGALANAYRQGVLDGVFPAGKDPFSDIRVQAKARKQPRPLAKDLLKLHELELPRRAQRDARNTLLLLFLLHGARVSEGLLLEWKDVGSEFVSYWPAKRGGRQKHVPISPLLQDILSQYPSDRKFVLPYVTERDERQGPAHMHALIKRATGNINAALSAITQAHGLAPLSSHMARRSFTDKALEEVADLREVQALLGHASVVTTEHYAQEVRRERVTAASRKVYRGTGGEHEAGNEPEPAPDTE